MADHSNGNLWREIVKVVVIAGITSAATTYATVQTLSKDVARIDARVEKLVTIAESFNVRLGIIETKAEERGPKFQEYDNRLRALELKR